MRVTRVFISGHGRGAPRRGRRTADRARLVGGLLLLAALTVVLPRLVAWIVSVFSLPDPQVPWDKVCDVGEVVRAEADAPVRETAGTPVRETVDRPGWVAADAPG